MKSRTSFFNKAVFRMNLTRFSPVWILYTIFMLMVVVLGLSNTGGDYWATHHMAEMIPLMGLTNLGYGLICAQILFGDLFNTRHCNALHAMPVTRTGLFLTNILSAFLFSFVPNALAALLAFCMLGAGRTAALWWLLGSMLEFCFFFGAAVLSMMCVGNRLAMGLVYAIINFLAMLALWFAASLYIPLMYGINEAPQKPFTLFSPVVQLFDYEYISLQRVPNISFMTLQSISLSDGWDYLTVLFLLGIVMLAVSLVMYRKRRLETAGDFIAIPKLRWVFLVIFTLAGGAFFQMGSAVLNVEAPIVHYILLLVGIVVAYHVGLMLIQRQVRVFSRKAAAGCCAIIAVFAVTLVLTGLDVFGVVRHIPDADEIESIQIDRNYYNSSRNPLLTEPEDIELIRALHADSLAEREEYIAAQSSPLYWVWNGDWVSRAGLQHSITITYNLKNGRTLERLYLTKPDRENGRIARSILTRPGFALQFSEAELPWVIENSSNVRFFPWDYDEYDRNREMTRSEWISLLEAVLADCKAGTMADSWAFHTTEGEDGFPVSTGMLGSIEFSLPILDSDYPNDYDYRHIYVWPDSENTVRWLIEHGYYDPALAMTDGEKCLVQ